MTLKTNLTSTQDSYDDQIDCKSRNYKHTKKKKKKTVQDNNVILLQRRSNKYI